MRWIAASRSDGGSGGGGGGDGQPERSRWACTRLHIAPLVALADTFQFLGSGMTVRFFSLFFWQKLGMHPIATNAVYAAGPVGIAISAILMQRVSRSAGRVLTTVVCRSLSVLLLASLALIMLLAPPLPEPHCPPSSPPAAPPPLHSSIGAEAIRTIGAPFAEWLAPEDVVSVGRCDALPVLAPTDVRWLVVPLYLLRTWLMNCTSGLTKSVLNDYVAKRHRAKWNALESVNLFSWSGSSMLGGYLIKTYGFNTTFIITAVLQAISIGCLLPLLPLVRAESSTGRAAVAGSASVWPAVADPGADAPSVSPLMLVRERDDSPAPVRSGPISGPWSGPASSRSGPEEAWSVASRAAPANGPG